MIVITGASDGLGLQVAKLYKEAGETVVNVSRRECKYADVNICLSLREEKEIKEAVKKILTFNENLDILINCAGVFSHEPFGNITESEIKRLMSTNVKPAILLTSLLKERINNDKTDILNVISTIAHKATIDEAVYGASKWALRGFTKNLQEVFKGKPNRVIAFYPGGINTNFFTKENSEADVDLKKFMDPSDVAVILKQTLDLPKNMEVSEIIINRK